MPLRAGSARIDITPPVGIAHANWGAAVHERAEGVDMPLWATALVLKKSGDQPVAVVDLDLLHLPTAKCDAIRDRVRELTGIAHERIRISWTHTHSGPTLSESTWVRGGVEMIGPYVNSLADRVAGIVWEALQRTSPVRLSYTTGACRVNVNRRLRLPEGRIVVGQNPEGFVDPTLNVLRFDREDAPPICLVGYACHPTIMAHRNRLITPDFPGVVKRVVEASLGGHTLFLQGSAGNQCSVEDLTSNPMSYRRVGSVIGHAAAELAWACTTPPRPMVFDEVVESGAPLGLFRLQSDRGVETKLVAQEHRIALPVRRLPPYKELERDYLRLKDELESLRRKGADDQSIRNATYQAKRASHILRLAEETQGADEIEMPVQFIRIGDAVLISTPAELFAEIGSAIRKASPFPWTLVSGYSNGVMGYFPTEQAFREGGYEVETSPFTGAAQARLVEGIVSLLERLH